MFTPPPSPMPFPLKADDSPSSTSPSSISLTTPGSDSEYPFPRVDTPSPKSPCSAEAGPSRIPLDVKKRTGRRTLLFIALLPAALILTASLRHFLNVPVLDEPPLIGLVKRDPEPQLLTISTSGTPTSSGPPPTTTSNPLSQSNGPTATSALPSVPTSPTLPTPFPQPFDLGLTSNFSTQGCEAFFADFTQEEDFRQCRSFSFLLNASNAFLQAQRNATLFNAVLWGTCNTVPSAATCAGTMSSYLTKLTSACKEDIANENPVAVQAQIGFQSYTAMRSAACLPDPTTNAYCYMDAVAATQPADIYFYALPLGTPLPNNTKPSCSPCVRSVLSVYAQYVDPSATGGGSGAVSIGSSTGNSSTSSVQASPLPVLSKTYPAAARLAVDQCGGTYASVGVAQPSGARSRRIAWSTVLLGAILVSWAM